MAASSSQYQQYPPPSSPPTSPPDPRQPPQSLPIQQSPSLQRSAQPAEISTTKTKSRTFSFRSNKSRDKSRRSLGNAIVLHETHAEKDARRLHSKADPTLAMQEAEPAVVAATAATSMSPLRAIQHKDAFGNIIADPDKSNPTRNRWERPLDTIRSFEAAIEGDYARRSTYRSDMDSPGNYSRRSSYHRPERPRFPQDSYYGNRSSSVRGDDSPYGVANNNSARNSYYENQSYTSQYGYGDPGNLSSASNRYSSNPRRTPSGHSQGYRLEPRDQPRVYPLPHKDRSYETVTSAAASGSSEAAGYQTDPTSSDNSSIRRASPIRPANDYDNGYNQSQPQKAPNTSPNFRTPRGNPVPNPMPNPPAPTHQSSPQGRTLRYQVPEDPQYQQQQQQQQRQPGRSPQAPPLSQGQQVQQQPAIPERKQSWLSRRLSKKS